MSTQVSKKEKPLLLWRFLTKMDPNFSLFTTTSVPIYTKQKKMPQNMFNKLQEKIYFIC